MQNELLDKALENCFNYYFNEHKNEDNSNSLASVIRSLKPSNRLFKNPLSVFLKLTSQCNLRCKHCFNYNNQDLFSENNDLTTDEIMNLVEYLIEELNVLHFTISGGEPFLQKDILKILKYIKSKNVYLQILTNATIIDENQIIEIGKIFNPETDAIQVSIDGSNEEIHDKTRGKGNFNKTIKAVKMLSENNIKVYANYTLTSQNISDFPNIYKLCKDSNIKMIIPNRFRSCSPEQNYLVPELEKVFINFSNLLDNMKNEKTIKIAPIFLKTFDFLAFETGRNLMDKYLLNNKKTECQNDYMCHKHERVCIHATGKVSLCPSIEDEELYIGDVHDSPFSDIWQNRFSSEFYNPRDLENSACKYCKYLAVCKGGCPFSAHQQYGKANSPDGDCFYAKDLTKNVEVNCNVR